MNSKIFTYPVLIKENHLDTFGHVNNASYLVLLEEARWDILTKNGYGLEKIHESRLGPAILEIKLTFLKELRLREEIVIETQIISYEKKIGRITQKMIRAGEVCCVAELVLGFFSLTERKLVTATPELLHAVGIIEV